MAKILVADLEAWMGGCYNGFMRQQTLFSIAVAPLALVCGSLALGATACAKSKTEEVLAKMEQFKKDACACKDEPCVDRVEQSVRAYQKATLESLRDGKATEGFIKKMMGISEEMETCASKYQLDASTKFVFEGLKKDLPEVKEKFAKGDVSSTDCVVVTVATENEGLLQASQTRPEIASVVKEADKLCKEDIPLLILESEVRKAEVARAKDAKGKAVLAECVSAQFSMALEEASKTPGAAEKAKAIEARFLAVCPKA